uniref:Immunoglobulin C1-set domain-containing protein n=1 Tax=Xiphophorus maculatus TaxID=8083 RepID=A0A3B5QXU1_XIPMA
MGTCLEFILFWRTRQVTDYRWNMYGCEFNDEYEEVEGWENFGYDGEDFIASITKNKWDNDKRKMALTKNYITQICPDWLKKYLEYGKNSLLKTVSFLQKSPSSPVCCHATGFYPSRAEMFWRKGEEEIHEGVDKQEILPNNDGTFQMSIYIDLSSVPTKDWTKHKCVRHDSITFPLSCPFKLIVMCASGFCFSSPPCCYSLLVVVLVVCKTTWSV